MIKTILALMSIDDFMGESENIDIAKGKYHLSYNFREVYKQMKRELLLKKKRSNGRN